MFHRPWPKKNRAAPCDAPQDAESALAKLMRGEAVELGSDEGPSEPSHSGLAGHRPQHEPEHNPQPDFRSQLSPSEAFRERPAGPSLSPHPSAAEIAASPVNKQAQPKPKRRALLPRLRAPDLSHWDIAPDLAVNIGSARWCRGVVTLLGLLALSFSFWPDFSAVGAAPPMRINEDARDEFRSHMIMPLALGADTGRHMPATDMVGPLKSAPERPQIDMVATLARGDSFSRMLRRAGVGEADIQKTSALVSSVVATDAIAPGTQMDITLGSRPAPGQPRELQSLAFRARFDLALALERNDGVLTMQRRPVAVDATPLRIRGTVGSSLYRSARAVGAPASAVQAYLATMGEHYDLDSAVRQGDEFDIIIEYRRAATGETKAGRLLYAGLSRDGKPRAQLMRWGKGDRFFEASGVGQQRSGLLAPVNGPVGSRYGMRRHPILGYMRMHRGLDYRAGYGTPIFAVTDGRVMSAGRAGGCGNTVKLAHAGGLATRYCHMSRMAVRAGQSVRRGQVIGYVGSTGLSTGPHLHYEMYRHGRHINPQSVSYVTSAQLSGSQLAAFKARLKELQSLTPGAALKPIATQAMAPSEPRREIEKLRDTHKVARSSPPASGIRVY